MECIKPGEHLENSRDDPFEGDIEWVELQVRRRKRMTIRVNRHRPSMFGIVDTEDRLRPSAISVRRFAVLLCLGRRRLLGAHSRAASKAFPSKTVSSAACG